MVLCKLPVPGRPTNLNYSRARAYCAFFLSSINSFLSPSLWEAARYRLKYCLKGPLSQKTTNQQINFFYISRYRACIRICVMNCLQKVVGHEFEDRQFFREKYLWCVCWLVVLGLTAL